jgi:hypothetical protein
MSAGDEYRAYARDCLRWAAKARTEAQRKQLLSLAKDWTQAAEGLEGLPSLSDLDCASHHLRARAASKPSNGSSRLPPNPRDVRRGVY